jgi:hypothetical protein
VDELGPRKASAAKTCGDQVGAEQRDDDAAAPSCPGPLVVATGREQEERDAGPERERERIAEAGQ